MATAPDNNPDITTSTSVRDRLLDAAEELFCDHGFEATTIRDIAAAAGCNIASVNYYFGGKRQLYIEMFRRHMAQLMNRQIRNLRQVMDSDNPTIEKLLRTTVTTGLATLAQENTRGSLLMLMVREMLNPHLKKEMLVNELINKALNSFCDAIVRLSPGITRDRAMLCLLAIDALVLHALLFSELYHEYSPHLELDRLIEHIVQIGEAGIQAAAKGNS